MTTTTIPASFNASSSIVDVAKEIQSLKPEHQKALIEGLLPQHRGTFLKTLIACMSDMQRVHALDELKLKFAELLSTPILQMNTIFAFTDKILLDIKQLDNINITKFHMTLFRKDINGLDQVYVHEIDLEDPVIKNSIQHVDGKSHYTIDMPVDINTITGDYELHVYTESVNLFGEIITHNDPDKDPDFLQVLEFSITSGIESDYLLSITKEPTKTEFKYFYYNPDALNGQVRYIMGIDNNTNDNVFEEMIMLTDENFVSFTHNANILNEIRYVMRTSNNLEIESDTIHELNNSYVYTKTDGYTIAPFATGDYTTAIEATTQEKIYIADILPKDDQPFVYDIGLTLNDPTFNLKYINLSTTLNPLYYKWDAINGILEIPKQFFTEFNANLYNFHFMITIEEESTGFEFTLDTGFQMQVQDIPESKGYLKISSFEWNDLSKIASFTIDIDETIDEDLPLLLVDTSKTKSLTLIGTNDTILDNTILPANETSIQMEIMMDTKQLGDYLEFSILPNTQTALDIIIDSDPLPVELGLTPTYNTNDYKVIILGTQENEYTISILIGVNKVNTIDLPIIIVNNLDEVIGEGILEAGNTTGEAWINLEFVGEFRAKILSADGLDILATTSLVEVEGN